MLILNVGIQSLLQSQNNKINPDSTLIAKVDRDSLVIKAIRGKMVGAQLVIKTKELINCTAINTLLMLENKQLKKVDSVNIHEIQVFKMANNNLLSRVENYKVGTTILKKKIKKVGFWAYILGLFSGGAGAYFIFK